MWHILLALEVSLLEINKRADLCEDRVVSILHCNEV
jgi:hypothetical protein